MDYRKLIGMVAADKNSQKLGIIVRIEDLLGKTIKKKKTHALIRYQKRFKKDIHVPIALDKLAKVEKGYVWFDITKKDFEKEVENIRKIRTEREIYSGDIKHTRRDGFKASRTLNTTLDITGLSKSKKERKR